MNKKTKLIILFPIVFILGFIIFKCAYLLYYSGYRAYDEDYASVKFSDKTVNTDKSLANTKFKNLNFYLPDGMVMKVHEQEHDEFETYINSEDADKESALKGIYVLSYNTNCEDFSKYADARKIDGKKIMEKNKFKNKYDVLKFIYDNFDKKNNIFTPLNEIKLNYFVNICSNITIISNDKNYYYLNGDVTGLYGVFDGHSEFRNEYSIDIFDEKNKQYYYISFNEKIDPYDEYPDDARYNELFTEEMMEKILSSLYFD